MVELGRSWEDVAINAVDGKDEIFVKDFRERLGISVAKATTLLRDVLGWQRVYEEHEHLYKTKGVRYRRPSANMDET